MPVGRRKEMKEIKKPVDIRKRTFDFAVRIVSLSSYLLGKPGVCRVLGNQLLKSGTSIGANIEEARAGQSRADFISKSAIALKEARETHYWLRLLVAAHVVPESRIAGLRDEAEEPMRIIGAILVNTKKRTSK
jgi:four helix bundle protein